jgi:hypothetical protein
MFITISPMYNVHHHHSNVFSQRLNALANCRPFTPASTIPTQSSATSTSLKSIRHARAIFSALSLLFYLLLFTRRYIIFFNHAPTLFKPSRTSKHKR